MSKHLKGSSPLKQIESSYIVNESYTTMGNPRDIGERRRLAVSDQLAPQVLQGHGRNAVVLQLVDDDETRTVLNGVVPITKTKRKESNEEYKSPKMGTWSSGACGTGWISRCYRL